MTMRRSHRHLRQQRHSSGAGHFGVASAATVGSGGILWSSGGEDLAAEFADGAVAGATARDEVGGGADFGDGVGRGGGHTDGGHGGEVAEVVADEAGGGVRDAVAGEQ